MLIVRHTFLIWFIVISISSFSHFTLFAPHHHWSISDWLNVTLALKKNCQFFRNTTKKIRGMNQVICMFCFFFLQFERFLTSKHIVQIDYLFLFSFSPCVWPQKNYYIINTKKLTVKLFFNGHLNTFLMNQ